MTVISELDEWRWLAFALEERKKRGDYSLLGICVWLIHDRGNRIISQEVYEAMNAKIEALPPLPEWGEYRWPTTPEGLAQRIAFCKEQVKLLEAAR
jgi:hypothetical protein